MNSFLIIILGLILGTTGSMMLFFMDYAKETPKLKSVAHLAIALVFVVSGFFMFGYYTKRDTGVFSSSNFHIKIKVRQEIVNGQEISIDTIYIFTPKKK